MIANLPYYAGTPIVRSLLERERRPESMTVMLQREVAQDMCALPGKMSLLSLAVQIYATTEIALQGSAERVQTTSKSAFDGD